MRRLTVLFYGFFLFCTLFMGSCEKNDNILEEATKNHIRVDNKEYLLNDALFKNYGTEKKWDEKEYKGYNLDLILSTEEISIQNGYWGVLQPMAGLLFLEMFSSMENDFDKGEYTYSSSMPHPLNTFDSGFFHYWDEEYKYIVKSEINGGIIRISKDEDQYIISINCTTENGEKIIGFYKGKLSYIDYRDEISPSTKRFNLFSATGYALLKNST